MVSETLRDFGENGTGQAKDVEQDTNPLIFFSFKKNHSV
jgi:hypothetical protein